MQSGTSTLALLPYFPVIIPTLRIRIHVVLLLIFIFIITFLDTILLTDAANCRSAEVHVSKIVVSTGLICFLYKLLTQIYCYKS